VLEAALWGFVGASALVVAAEIAFRFTLSPMVVGLIMAFGVGTLVAAIAFDLVGPAMEGVEEDETWLIPVSLLVGALVFFLGDRLVEGMGSPGRAAAEATGDPDDEAGDSGLGIALGAALDGIPESLVLGMSLASGSGVSVALLAAIWISNFPESLGSSVDMLMAGRSRHWVRGLWLAIAAVSTICAAIGYVLISGSDAIVGAAVQAFAAGALLTMIMDEMAPQAFGRSHLYTGLATTAGFVLALGLTTLE